MFLGRVIGTLETSTAYEGLEGVKLLWVQPVDSQSQPRGRAIVACDSQQAGLDELVFLVDGREATLALPNHFVPVDATIVGIVDEVNIP